MNAAAAVASSFASAFGSPADGVWSAPGRVNLTGEHTDYNAGLCLPMALPRRTFAAVRRRPDRLLRIRSLQASEVVEVELGNIAPGTPAGWGGYAAGVLWALEKAGHEVGGLDVLVDGQVPLGSGLSSSAALECAVALAAADLFDLGLGADETGRAGLAQLCAQAENTIAQAPTGGMDQSAAMLCQQGYALLLDCRDGSTTQVPLDLASHDLTVLVMDTKASHTLVDGQYAERRRSCVEAAATLGVSSLREVRVQFLEATLDALGDPLLRRRARHVITEIERVRVTVDLISGNDFVGLGDVFDASHRSMRDDFEISCVELDLAVDTACSNGALAARMTGGGFGRLGDRARACRISRAGEFGCR